MIQFQRNNSRIWSMPETIEEHGKKYSLVKKGGGSYFQREIRNYQYDHPEKEFLLKCPNGDDFLYLYEAI